MVVLKIHYESTHGDEVPKINYIRGQLWSHCQIKRPTNLHEAKRRDAVCNGQVYVSQSNFHISLYIY
jgi:hypothetical protein